MTKLGSPIIILGMHRSGTSVVASILHNMNVSMGSEFLEADQFNPYGYYEDKEFLWINKGIIENAGGTWYAPPTIEEIRKGGNKFIHAIEKVVAIRRNNAGSNCWGWKDPRNCLTCRIYDRLLPDVKYIVVVRRLADIKASLYRAHGGLANWDKLIQFYYDSVDNFFEYCTKPVLSVGFEELVYKKYTEKTVLKLLDFVGKPDSMLERAVQEIRFR